MGDPVSGRLSVVIPSCNEEELISLTAQTLTDLLTREGVPFELLFVDDGSRDRTWDEIQSAAARDDRVRGLRFSRNFGKEAAIFAGLANAGGDCCAVMDWPSSRRARATRRWSCC